MKCYVNSLPIVFDNYDKLLFKLNHKEVKTVTCINQHYFNLMYDDRYYYESLLKFDLIFGDGLGVKILAFILCPKLNKIQRITGSDYYLKILSRLNELQSSIFLFGDKNEILDKAIKFINNNFSNIKITGSLHGYRDLNDKKIVNYINKHNSDYLLVGLGAPRQEEWITKYKNEICVNKIIAVGGWFRILANDRKRGPKLFQCLGLEWFIRLLTEPKYVWKRYLIGIPLFIYRIIILKLKKPK